MAGTALSYDLADWVVSLNAGRYVILPAIVIFFLVMGCVMSVMPMILLTLPAMYPTIVSLGLDPVRFGVVTVILVEAGQLTPPVGINVFALDALFPSIAADCLPSSRSGDLDGTDTAKRGFVSGPVSLSLHKNVKAGEWTFSVAF